MAVGQEAMWRALGRQYAREIDRDVLLIPEVTVENLSLECRRMASVNELR
jgi:hypothetical protein